MEHHRELWNQCSLVVELPEAGEGLKQMAISIRRHLRLEARVNQLEQVVAQLRAECDRLREQYKGAADASND
jgi:uncharacterized protein YceH (UPF0502 family)